MSSLRVVAPGKLMLAGEYSVLLPGGVAWALAVPLGVELEATCSERWELSREDLNVRWVEGAHHVPDALRFAHSALLAVRDQLDVAPHRLSMKPSAGVETGPHKPGVGGSAAVCAAVCAALHALDTHELAGRRDAIFETALGAHRDAQGGRGSGYDVATVVYGELTRFQAPRSDEGPSASALPWPSGLHALTGITGQSADTRTQIARLERRRREDAPRVEQALRDLAAPVAELDGLFTADTLPRLLATLSACQSALERFDQRLSLGVITPPIMRLLTMAQAAGVTAKVSGAGGGDSVIALDADRSRLEALATAWRTAGFEARALRPAAGVDIESRRH